MVETRDQETGEIVKQLVDKVRRHKVTRLKKTILAARKHKELVVQKSSVKQKVAKDPTESGFETESEEDEKTDEIAKETPTDLLAEIGPSIFGDLSVLKEEILTKINKSSETVTQLLSQTDTA